MTTTTEHTPLERFVAQTNEAFAWADMVKQRIPEIGPELDRRMAEAAAEIMDVFKPWIDLDEGTITTEEFEAILARRAAEELAHREKLWADSYDEDDDVWYVTCGGDHCGGSDLEFEDLPPLRPLCDVCEQAEDDELFGSDDPA